VADRLWLPYQVARSTNAVDSESELGVGTRDEALTRLAQLGLTGRARESHDR